MKRTKPNSNPYRPANKKRRAALAYLAARSIVEPKQLYATYVDEVPLPAVAPRRLTLVS